MGAEDEEVWADLDLERIRISAGYTLFVFGIHGGYTLYNPGIHM